MGYYALIKDNLVKSVIVAESSFLPQIESEYDYIIDVTSIESRPSVEDSYYPDTGAFISNIINTPPALPVDFNLPCFDGTDEGFESFTISKYLVKFEDGMIHIGCKAYPAAGFLYALYKVLEEDTSTTSCFSIISGNPAHGKFEITWDDAELLYQTLKKVKLT